MFPSLRIGPFTAVLLCALAASGAPGRADEPAIPKLLEQLGDDDLATRKAAMKRLEALGEGALPALRQVIASDADVDVRLRAAVVAGAIDGKLWGEVRAMG